jgi:glycopeptide antibiotics resistance protein
MRARTTTGLWGGILAAFLAVLALVGFWPSPVDRPLQSQLTAFLLAIHTVGVPGWVNYGFIEASANVALFVPLGVLATLAFRGKLWWQIGGFGLLISGAMESGQLLFLHSRYPSALDLATNTAGCLLGFLLASSVRSWSSIRAN